MESDYTPRIGSVDENQAPNLSLLIDRAAASVKACMEYHYGVLMAKYLDQETASAITVECLPVTLPIYFEDDVWCFSPNRFRKYEPPYTTEPVGYITLGITYEFACLLDIPWSPTLPLAVIYGGKHPKGQQAVKECNYSV